jgi:hypothetical protein
MVSERKPVKFRLLIPLWKKEPIHTIIIARDNDSNKRGCQPAPA